MSDASDPSGISLGGVAIPAQACLDAAGIARGLDEARALIRMSDGTLVIQERWSRATYALSGGGWVPPGLLALSRSGSLPLVYPDPAHPGQTLTVSVQITDGPAETFDLRANRVSWSVTLREV